MRKLLGSLVFLLIGSISFAQDLSNKGKDFWLVFPAHVPSSGNAQMGLFLTSDKNSSGTISVNGWSTTFTVTANQVTGPINVPYSVANIGNVNTVVNKGINVKVNPGQPAVVLYAHIYAGARSEASLILPVQTLGKKYYSTNFFQASTGGSRSQFNIVATEPNTVVEYQLRINGVLNPTVNTVNLPNVGDQIQVQNANDLTGSLIQSVAGTSGSCKRIAVFSGSSALAISSNTCNGDAYDPLFQQCYPTNTWGKNFGVVPLLNNPNGYHVRVMAMENNTNINFNGTNIVLNAGEFYPASNQFPVPYTTALDISGDKPISVSQYMMSRFCTGAPTSPTGAGQGDPDMIILNPVEQNISDISIFSSNLQVINTKFLNIYIKTAGAASFRINGNPPNGTFVPMANGNGYSYLQENLTNYLGTFFRLTSDSGFNAITYGMGDAESYGYSAGTNVKDLYQQVGVSSQYGIEDGPTVCTGSPFKFKISLPYMVDSMRWNLSSLPGTPANVLMTYSNPPVPTDADSTTVVNGKTIYWYSLPSFYTFNTVGSYPVSITAYASTSEGCGNEQIIDFELEINNPPAADFNWVHNGCIDQSVQFNDQTISTKPTYRWWWDFGDPASGAANNSLLKDPVHTFSAPGTYTVRYSNITTPGCLSDTISKTIVIHPLPVGNIAGDITVCRNAPSPNVVFTGTTGTAPFTFTYNINNGPAQTIVSSTGNSVSLPVPTGAAGTFNYHLVSIRDAAGTAGCFRNNPDTVRVIVNPLPTAGISGTVAVCQNAPAPLITFTGAGSTAPYTFQYNINGGAPLSITTTAGNTVTLAVPTGVAGPFTYNLVSVQDASTAACLNPQPASVTVTVNPLPTATLTGSVTEVCVGGTPPVVTFTGSGSTAPYTFTYTLNGGAQQTITSAGNTATITIPTTAAGSFAYNLVSVRDASGTSCLQAQAGSATVTVHPLPTAGFTVGGPFCETRTLSFTDASVANAGAISSWAWDFGDPSSGAANISALQNPTHVFAGPGTYTVTLTVTNNEGCIGTSFQRQVTVSTLPTAAFSMPEVCLLDPFAQFTDNSTSTSPATLLNWNWTFGDPASGPNNTSNVQNAQHTYSAVGNYNVRLVVTTNFGCTDTLTQQLTVNGGNPVSNFIQLNPTSSCSSDTVSIQNKSTIASGNITKVVIHWDNTNQPAVFETDEDPVFDKIYKHKYPTSTSTVNYNVRFRAYSGGVCVNDRILPVTVLATPDVSIAGIPDQCYSPAPLVLNFGSEAGGVVGTATYSGPGVSFNGTNWVFNSTVAGIGDFEIRYKFTATAGGCVDSTSTMLKVLDTATARFSPQRPACEKKTVSFNEQSTAPASVTLSNTVWDFGDGTPSQTHPVGGTVSHLYAATGTYTVTMYNVAVTGCRSTAATVQVLIDPRPSPNFSFPASLCLPAAEALFTNTSSIADGTESSFTYLWDFGDPASGTANTSTLEDPTHIFSAIGPYDVKLQVRSGVGCVHDTTIVLNTIHPQPKADFSISPAAICLGDNVGFSSQSNGGDGTISSWNWNFDDGSAPATVANPSYLYTTAGSYDVQHFITNSHGCNSDTVSKVFKVYALPTVNAGPDVFVLEGGTGTLEPVYTGEDNIYLWSPADYLNSSSIARPVTRPLQDITYTITVSNPGGCSASDEVFVKVLKGPKIPNTFSPNGDGINDRWIIEYLDTYPNCKVVVFTRAGQKVFESRGYKIPWNGTTNNGKSLPLDTYYYIIEPENGRAPVTGYITIIK